MLVLLSIAPATPPCVAWPVFWNVDEAKERVMELPDFQKTAIPMIESQHQKEIVNFIETMRHKVDLNIANSRSQHAQETIALKKLITYFGK